MKNFEGGIGVSKWYRGVSIGSDFHREYGDKMAVLNVMGVTNSMIEKYHYEEISKKPIQTSWLDFASKFVRYYSSSLFPTKQSMNNYVDFVFQESETETTVEVNVTLRLRYYKLNRDYEREYVNFKLYHGKSTRPLKRTRRPQNEKEKMRNEAKKAALIECFKDRFGFTQFDDIFVDELHRPSTK